MTRREVALLWALAPGGVSRLLPHGEPKAAWFVLATVLLLAQLAGAACYWIMVLRDRRAAGGEGWIQ